MLTFGYWTLLLGLLVGIAETRLCGPNRVSIGNDFGYCISAKECIRRGFHVYGRRCVHSCPIGTYFLQETQTCYNQCPTNTILIGTACLNGTYCKSKHNQVLFNGTCLARCPPSMPFKKDGTCYKTCPPNTFVNGSECLFLEECKKNGFVNGSACVAKCPLENKYTLQGVCHHSCPPSVAVKGNGTSCLTKEHCTVKLGNVIFNNSCVEACPQEAPYSDHRTCINECPTGKILLGSECVSVGVCWHRNMSLYQNACVANCPDVAPFLVDRHCHGTCPETTVLFNGSCINARDCLASTGRYMVIFNGTCVDKCPLEAPINNKGICVRMCPNTNVASDMQCVDNSDCLENNRYILNGTCVSKCPQTSPYVLRRRCYQSCPEGSVISEQGTKLCVEEPQCTSLLKKVYNNTCVTSCPLESQYIYSSHCYPLCPNKTVSLPSRLCISAFNCKVQRKFVQDTECRDTCSPNFPYTMDHTCYAGCPPNSSLFPGNRCVTIKNCRFESNAIIYNGTCLPSCPQDVPYRQDGKCVTTCPEGLLTKSHDCIHPTSCQPGVIYNGTCLPSCPQDVPYRQDGKCVATCPEGLLTKSHDCIHPTSCQPGVIYNGTCLPSCPQDVPYRQDGKCVATCPEGLLTKSHDCIHPTSCQPGVIYNGTCLSSCPKNAPYRHDGKCLSKCPGGMVVKESTCERYCISKYIYNGTCRSACPIEAPYTTIIDPSSLGKICYSMCPKNWVLNGSSCAMELLCILSNIYFVYNGTCVTKCPPGASTFVRGVCYDTKIEQNAIKVIPALILVMLVLLYCLVHNPKNPTGKEVTELRPENQNLLDGEDEDDCAALQTEPTHDQETLQGLDLGKAGSEVIPLEEVISLEEVTSANSSMAEGGVSGVIVHQDDTPLLLDDSSLIQLEGVDRQHLADDVFLFGDGSNG